MWLAAIVIVISCVISLCYSGSIANYKVFTLVSGMQIAIFLPLMDVRSPGPVMAFIKPIMDMFSLRFVNNIGETDSMEYCYQA